MRALTVVGLGLSVLLVSGSAKAAPPAEEGWHPNSAFIAGGLLASAAAYGLSAAAYAKCCRQSELLVPFVGPMIRAVEFAGEPLPSGTSFAGDYIGERTIRWLAVGAIVADSAVQVGGVALAALGLAGWSPFTARARVTPVVSFSQIGVRGEF